MNKYIFPIIKWKIKPWLKYYILNKLAPSYPLSEIIEGTSPLTLENSIRKKFHIFNVSGNTIQNGEPTPETPIPVENVSGEVEVKVENQNILNIPDQVKTSNGLTITVKDNKYIVTGAHTASTTYIILDCSLTLEPGTYTMATNSSQPYYPYMQLRNKTTELVTTAFADKGLKTFTLTEKITIDNVRLYFGSSVWSSGAGTLALQIVKGSENKEFVPHEEQTATFPLAEGQVLHLEDTLEADGIHQRRKITELTSDNVSRLVTAINTTSFAVPFVYIPKSLLGAKPIYQKYTSLINKYSEIGAVAEIKSGTYTTSFEQGSIYVFDERFTNLETARQLLIGTIIEIQQADEIIVPYTEEQQTAYNNLKDLYSYKGTTHISSSNEPSPVFEVQYYMEGDDV